MSDPSACHSQACAIQNCLQRHGYNESKCTALIDQLYECCSQFYETRGELASAVACPKPHLLRLKIEQRQQEQVDAQLLVHKSQGRSTR